MKKKKLTIAIPSSFVSEQKHLRKKTRIIGIVGRTASIFRVDEIILFKDKPDETKLIKTILGYMESPQYLRKRIYKKIPELRYVGTLPPLRTPHHPLKDKLEDIKIGEYREGMVLEVKGTQGLVDVGLQTPLKVNGNMPSRNARISVKITEKQPHLKGIIIPKNQISEYWGYKIQDVKSGLNKLLLEAHFDLRIGTSRKGTPINKVEETMKKSYQNAEKVLIVFGSNKKSITEILQISTNKIPRYFDFYLNMVPNQGTATIRTEEAIQTTLSILNLYH
jgi:predicted SPOUT superfamily RNA methylase MTH1